MKFLRKQGLPLPKAKIIDFKNMENLPSTLNQLSRLQGFENVRRIRIVADGTLKRRDREHELYATQMTTYLKDFADYNYYLFPYKSAAGNWRPGFMEDVLLETLREETSESCHYISLRNIADDFLLSTNNTRGKENRFINHNRHVLCTYFAGTNKLAGMRLGEAAEEGAYDLGSDKFNDLKEMFEQLLR